MTKPSCSTCDAYTAASVGNGVCRALPPQVTIVLMPRGQVQMELVPMPISSQPSAEPTGWCRLWGQAIKPGEWLLQS